MYSGLQSSGKDYSGALDRETFFELAAMKAETVFKESSSCCLAMAELDDYESLTRQFGRDVMKRVAHVMLAFLREDDFMGRYDAKKFAIFFTKVDKQKCLGICDRLAQNLKRAPLALEQGMVYASVSFSVAEAEGELLEPQRRLLRSPWESIQFIQKLAAQAERTSASKMRGQHHGISVRST